MASNKPTEIDHTLAVVGGSTTSAEVGLETTGLFQKISDDLAGLGRRFVVFLKNIGRTMLCRPCIIVVPRPPQLMLRAFVGGQEGWRFADEETDTRAASMRELDLSRIRFRTMRKSGESPINGEERMSRAIEAGHIRLDVGMFGAIRANRHRLSKDWKDGDRYIHFDGSVVLSPVGDRFVFCMYWHEGQWYDTLDWLGLTSENDDSVSVLLNTA